MYSLHQENLLNDLLDFLDYSESFIDISVATDAMADTLELTDQVINNPNLIATYRLNAEFYLKAGNQEIVKIWKTLSFKERFMLRILGEKEAWFSNKLNELKFNAELNLNEFLYNAHLNRENKKGNTKR